MIVNITQYIKHYNKGNHCEEYNTKFYNSSRVWIYLYKSHKGIYSFLATHPSIFLKKSFHDDYFDEYIILSGFDNYYI